MSPPPLSVYLMYIISQQSYHVDNDIKLRHKKSRARRRGVISYLCLAEYMLHEIWELLSPPRPIVIHVISPEVRPVRHVLVVKDLVKLRRVHSHLVFPGTLPAAEDYVPLPVEVEPRMIVRHVRQEVNRRIVVHDVIHVIAEEPARIEQTA